MSYRVILVMALCAVAFSAFAAEPDADDQVNVPVAAHDIARGSVLTEQDLANKAVPALRADDSIVHSIADATGKEVRRALRAGEIIRASDLKRPTVVAKGSTVTMLFEAPGMTLTAVGRALAEGGEGDSISVLNPASYRQVEALIVGPGTVRVGGAMASVDVAQQQ